MSASGKILQKLAGQTMVYGLGTIVPRLLNYLLLTPFYTRVFQQGEYGTVTELYAYVAFLMVLLTYGMETAYFRFASKTEDEEKIYTTSLFSLLISSGFFIGIMILFSRPVAGWIHYSSHPEYILLFSLIVSIDAFCSIPFARLRQRNRPGRFAMIRIVNVLVNIGFNVFFLVVMKHLHQEDPQSIIGRLYDPEFGVGYAFVANLIATLVTLVMLLPDIVKLRWRFDKTVLLNMLAYAFPMLIVGLAGMVNEVSDKLLLKYLLPDPTTALAELGVYGANYKLAVLMTLFIQMFRYAAEPFFFAQASEENARPTYALVMKYFVIFGLLIFLGVMLFLDLVKYFIGPDFRGGLGIVPIVLMANLFLGIFYNLAIWFKLTDRTWYGAVLAIGGALITVIFLFGLVPRFGYVGAAWAHFACYGSMMVMSYVWGQKHYKVPYDLRTIGLYALVALVLFGLSQWVNISSLALRLGVNSLLLVLFVGVVWVKERGMVLNG